MAPVVTPADPAIRPEQIADLLWSTDPALWAFLFGKIAPLCKVLAHEWPSQAGLLCHAQSFTARGDDAVDGLLVAHSATEYARNFEFSVTHQAEALSPEEAAHLQDGLYWMDRLFPEPRPEAFYILEFAVRPSAQGSGIARLLLDAAKDRARARGCDAIALDVAADNPAVGFYRHLGFETNVETRVPYLHEVHGIGPHLHMICPLDRLP